MTTGTIQFNHKTKVKLVQWPSKITQKGDPQTHTLDRLTNQVSHKY